MRVYNFPVFATQGGGLVREVRTDKGYKYIFVEKPDCPGLDVGDFMPQEWSIVPANQLARDSVLEEDYPFRHGDLGEGNRWPNAPISKI